MSTYKDLHIWQKSMILVNDVYDITRKFPKDELFALTSQIRRSAISIPSNVAEGAGRNSDAQMIYFLAIASGSALELETQLIISKNQKYINEIQLEELSELINEIQKMNYKFQKKLNEQ